MLSFGSMDECLLINITVNTKNDLCWGISNYWYYLKHFKMKNIKDILIGIFAVIGFTSLITGFTTNNTNSGEHTVPESHVWSIHSSNDDHMYSINAVTGEVRKYSNGVPAFDQYRVMVEKKPKQKNN